MTPSCDRAASPRQDLARLWQRASDLSDESPYRFEGVVRAEGGWVAIAEGPLTPDGDPTPDITAEGMTPYEALTSLVKALESRP